MQELHSGSLRRFWKPGTKPGAYDNLAISELASPGSALPGYLSLTTSEWHFIRDSEGHKELYRWTDSPDESANLAASLPDETARLEALLRERIRSSLGPWTEPRYLSALGSPDGLATDGLGSGGSAGSGLIGELGLMDRIGSSQACFPARTSPVRRLPRPDEELLRSLPYH